MKEEEFRKLMGSSSLRIGVDIGGTFTDFVIFNPDDGQVTAFKMFSTPGDPAKAVIDGLERIKAARDEDIAFQILHGSTVATNALLERKGAKTALITTQGFRDVLQIGRQNRPSLYDFRADPPPPLVPDQLRFEVEERINQQGEVLVPLDPSQVEGLISKLLDRELESVAVCLLFSFLHPEHEQAIANRLRQEGFFVSASGEILPEFREYERTSTTVINAYVSPILDGYLSRLEAAVSGSRLRIMQSNGGVISIPEARRAGVRCILSGPAGGVVGSAFIAKSIGRRGLGLGQEILRPGSGQASAIGGGDDSAIGGGDEAAIGGGDELNGEVEELKVITFDMGGTSTDVSLIDGTPRVTTEAKIGGHPIGIPVLDIHTIGAGGGSIARVDLGGALRVGPESAGADPGPACYARADLEESQATVTDANLVLGRLDPGNFLGGRMPLDAARALHVLTRLGGELGLDPVQTALGVLQIANAHMERALRLISVERGYDPRDFILLSFGGAGGLHASDLARGLGIPRVLVPPLAATLSAFGMLTADVVKDYAQTIMAPDDARLAEIASAYEPLVQQAFTEVLAEGVPTQEITIQRFMDVRYRGQSYELTIPFDENVRENFHRAHRQTYGYDRQEAPVEFVNMRVRAIGEVKSPHLSSKPLGGRDPSPARMGENSVEYPQGTIRTPFYRWERLEPSNHIDGPAIIIREDTTVLINPDDDASIDEFGNLIIRIGG